MNEDEFVNNNIEKSIIESIDGPTDRKEIESSVDYPDTKIRSVLREMLYSGQVETTPEWKYEISENRERPKIKPQTTFNGDYNE